MNADQIYFNYYPGNIKHKRKCGSVSLNQFIRANKEPNEKMIEIFNKLENVNSKAEKRSLKGQLYSFTPSVLIKEVRRYADIISFTGLAQLDFDGLEHEYARQLKLELFETYNPIVCAYISPSKKGLKALVRIPIVDTIEQYKGYYRGIISEFSNYEGFDDSPKNAVLPLFLSYDKELLYRENPSVWDVYEEEEKKYINNLEDKVYNDDNRDYNYNKVVRIVSDSINGISTNGHPTVVKTSLIIGSRVSAGYIGKFEAETLMINLISVNHYLSKGVDGYIKTALWGIEQGMKQARYY